MVRVLFANCVVAALAFVPLDGAHSASESVLYSFCSQTNCTDGAYPFATLVADGSGNLYGTTYDGGANDEGEVFELAPDGALTVLHSFAGTDGARPRAGVIIDASGNLYGSTAEGGNTGPYCGDTGCGTVFKLAPDGTLSVLYAFSGSDGAEPFSALLMDSGGNLYGTTVEQSDGYGVVFEVAADGTEKQLYSFCSETGCADGVAPWAPLVMDRNGNLYGTAIFGGIVTRKCDFGCGTIFELTPAGKETTLYAFEGKLDGAYPTAGLASGGGGFFGTASEGGSRRGGTVFEIGKHGNFDVLHEFGGKGDARLPYAALIPDGNGGYYGTACTGGAGKRGAVFDVAASGAESIVYSFKGRKDGMCPESSLLEVNRTLYGTTLQGGGTGCTESSGCGIVFAINE